MARPGHDTGARPAGSMRRRPHPEGNGSAEAAGHDGKTLRRWVLLLLAAVTAAYANHFRNGYHFDDFHTIVNNSYIRSLHNLPRFFTDATTFSSLPTNQSYRPLVTTTLAFDYFLGQGQLFFFHLSTFLLFLVQGVVMYALFKSIYDGAESAPANRYVALTAVAWYLLHPANAETINYIIARSDSLSTLFILLAFASYVHWERGRRRCLYLIPFALACLAKPIGTIFAPLLFLYIYLFEEQAGGRLARLGAALKTAAPALLAGLLLMVFIKSMDPPTWTPGGTSAFHYIITQPFVLLHYFTTFFVPVGLSADTDWKTLPSLYDARFLVGMLFLAGLIAIGVVAARAKRWRPVAFGILWFLVTLLPTSLIPLAEVMNDHRLFLPYVGLALSVCWTGHLLLAKASSRFGSQERYYRMVTIALLATLTAYGYGTHVRNGVWRTEETLWRDVVTKSPENGRGLMNYGLALMKKGDYANAEKYFAEAMKFTPNYANLHVNIGLLKNATGKAAEAEPYFRKAIQLNPDWPGGYYWYAHFLNKQKRYEEAIPKAQKALQLAPAELEARKLLMDIYRERGQFAELRELARQTLRIAPGDVKAKEHLAAAEQGEASRR